MMLNTNVLEGLNAVLKTLDVEFSKTETFNFRINNIQFCMPSGVKCEGHITPDIWIERQHKDGSVHEPGLSGILLYLATVLHGKEVDFVDVGALFGYFSLLAARCFSKAAIHSIEPNPHSFAAMSAILKWDGGHYHTYETLIGIENERAEFLQSGFSFLPIRHLDATQGVKRQAAKELLNRARCNGHQIQKIRIMKLQDLLTRAVSSTSQLILKIDAEGQQAVFLPPATKYLINRRAILLLEFDTPQKLERYHRTNMQICKPFLDNGYRLFWLDHRILHCPAVETNWDEAGEELEKNSLGILLPANS